MIIRDTKEKDTLSILSIASSSEYICMNEKNIKLYLGEKIYKCLSAEYNGVFAGFIVGSIIENEGEIIDIAVDVSFKKKGIASSLLNSFINYAKIKNVEKIILDVNEYNSEALSFYKKQNFIEYGIRKNYYEKPKRANAILMKLII